MQAKRKLVYAYLTLSYPTIIEIASKLSLVHDEDRGISDQELYKRVIERAEQGQKLGELWEQVGHHNKDLPENPFIPTLEDTAAR